MSDKREYTRTPFVCRIRISHESIGELEVKTRDVSDGGVFVVLEPEQVPPIGSVVTGQVQGLVDEAPVVNMEVVRVEPGGVGLKFLGPGNSSGSEK
ncbi:PilZ domain-containing protein [Marinimicrobium sp. ABcell2]|uniref:PilZ domain-containing protein n=1 Tax=Marinimicrobium sp. ABcell2 TaxID=3069751 RepID=UPI0027B11649|nr:PilZ domain-containing protein [Marinimicrobium sp. ABcell2]MDQ2076495.1 PilZ domain-containing protein [Marinimicrobium sp. ABcell2]